MNNITSINKALEIDSFDADLIAHARHPKSIATSPLGEG